MALLKIIKLTNNVWKHNSNIDGDFILTKFYAKQEFGKFLIVESYGSKRREYLISEIEVYNIGGSAETFTTFDLLFIRLKALGYTGYYEDGTFIFVPSDYISNDANNALVLGTDNKYFASGAGGGGGAELGKIRIVDKLGEFFTNLATASAYIRTFTNAVIAYESFSNGVYYFTVPNGSDFSLADDFLANGSLVYSAYVEDTLGLINNFGAGAFAYNSGNNILGNCTFGDYAFDTAFGNNTLGDCTFGIYSFIYTTGNNTLGNCTFGSNAFDEATGNNILGDCTFGSWGFRASYGDNILGNCTFASNCFDFSKGINKFKNILLTIATDNFAAFSTGRFEIYGNIGINETATYTNFFPSSNATIWADKSKETSNAGAIEGDLATAQTNGSKLFFGYAPPLNTAFTDIVDLGGVTGSVSIDWSLGVKHKLNLTGNVTITQTNYAAFEGQKVQEIQITSSDPSYTITWVDVDPLDFTDAIDFATGTTYNNVSVRLLRSNIFQSNNLVR
jgi:hypothetical protein